MIENIDYYNDILENDIDPVLFIVEQNFMYCNKAALKILQMKSKSELYNIHPSQISPTYQPDGQLSSEKADVIFEQCYKNGFARFEWLHKDLKEKEFWVEVTLKRLTLKQKEILLVTWRDISQVKEKELNIQNKNTELKNDYSQIEKLNYILKDSGDFEIKDTLLLLEEYKKAIDESSIVSKTDTKGIITYVNSKFCEISGYSKDELLGANHNIIRDPANTKEFFKIMWDTLKSKNIFKGIVSNRRKDRSIYYVDSTIIPILDYEGNITEYIGIRNDITSLYEKDKIITKQLTDDLTGLPNRQKLIGDSKTFLFPKLAIVNINHFRDINDTYGIEVGDHILKEFSQKLLKLNNFNINVYRISGDIFGILASGNFTIESLKELSLEFLDSIKTNPIIHDNHTLNLSFSIGISSGREWLLVEAEMALMQAKEKNKELIINLEQDSKRLLAQKIELTKNIKTALSNDKILLYGQKIVNNKTGEIKYETLMRLKTEDGKILSPYFFLEHAKKARLYHEMTRMMIKQACDYFKDKENMFSINLSMQDITNDETIQFLLDTILQTKTNNQIILEIVESEQINQFEKVSSFIKKMKEIGAKIAIDDFGTGYSNFEYIINLNVDILKIDGSLIRNIHKDKNIFITVSTIVNFAKQLGLEVVAEFVDSKEVLETIKSLDIEYSQGFYLHEPEHLI
ncbi:GGDEF domain-containing phosphodiesterase [uncultured Arcobacter sp.]|uniref:bifunctional diguanylate cyclase/phosphodiesterase n=1 Tax=uncultured Arcobacter sp. TaxID=165434 RepID=UPI0026351847|nr:GGDEF domain-containing phosphodiesterase [uncultured Arcobacter sp.]